jgi:hypothetical protein
MAELYTAGTAFTTATCVEAWIEYPFRDQGDSATKIYHHKMKVARGSYAPLDDDDVMTAAGDKPTRSPFSDDSGAYYIGDTVPQAIDGGLVEFDRMFANIPADRTTDNGLAEPNGLYAFEFPRVTLAVATGYKTSTGNESTTRSVITTTQVFDLSAPDVANFAVGDYINVKNTADEFYFKYYSDVGLTNLHTYRFVVLQNCLITSIATNTVTCTYEWQLGHATIYSPTAGDDYNLTVTTYQAAQISLPIRETLLINSPSFIQSKYVKSSAPTELALGLEDKFIVLDATGNVVDSKTIISTTIPTRDEYANWVVNGLTINGEAETIRRWKGNIFEKSIIKVVAK